MVSRSRFQDVDGYLASLDPESRGILQEIRQMGREAVPGASECIGYQMPALKLQRIFFYYASFKNHIGIYPPVKGDPRLNQALLPYRGPKGNLQFRKDQPIPFLLIKRVIETLAEEGSGSPLPRTPTPGLPPPPKTERRRPMASKTPGPRKHERPADTTRAVDAFMAVLDHPFKTAIEEVRQAILGADPAVAEGIKWNAPSFRTTEYFATTNLRETSGIGVILHLGAKVRAAVPGGLPIQDPGGLLTWLSGDRAMVVFKGTDDFQARRDAFVDLVRQWIRQV